MIELSNFQKEMIISIAMFIWTNIVWWLGVWYGRKYLKAN